MTDTLPPERKFYMQPGLFEYNATDLWWKTAYCIKMGKVIFIEINCLENCAFVGFQLYGDFST